MSRDRWAIKRPQIRQDGGYHGDVRSLLVLACAGCGRLAFDERLPDGALDGPVAPDGPEIRCTTESFDQLPPGFDKNGNGDINVVDGKVVFAIDGILNSEAYLSLAVAGSPSASTTYDGM